MGKVKKSETKPQTATKTELVKKLGVLVDKYNDHEHFHEREDASKTKKEIDEVLAEINSICETECFNKLIREDDTMLAAAKMLRFDAKGVKNDKETDKLVVVDTDKPIDVLKLHKRTPDGIGVDKNWATMIEHLNRSLTIRRAIELGIEIDAVRSSFAMKDEASIALYEFEKNGKTIPKDANKKLKETMQEIVGAMIGNDYIVTDAMVNYILAIFSKKNNRQALSVTCANHRYMRQYMLEICHAAATNAEFTIKYKQRKAK